MMVWKKRMAICVFRRMEVDDELGVDDGPVKEIETFSEVVFWGIRSFASYIRK